MTSPPYLIYRTIPYINLVQHVYVYKKQHLSNVNNSKMFLYYMLCVRTFAPALFNSNVKYKQT